MTTVVLGLLMICPMSQYDLMRAFERTISLFYRSSPGGIRRALDTLATRGEIEPVATGSARGRRPWAVTDAGRAQFRAWMLDPAADGERDRLARLFFLGLLPPSDRAGVLEQIRASMAAELARLEALRTTTAAEPVPDELQDVARYQSATLELGLAQAAAAVEWVSAFAAASPDLGPVAPATQPPR